MDFRTRRSLFGLGGTASLCVGLIAAGCGGGGSTGSSSGPSQTAHVGPVAVSFSGHPQAAVNGVSGQVTAEGQAGASFTSLSTNPAHNLASTYFAFSRNYDGGYYAMYTAPSNGFGGQTPLPKSGPGLSPSFSQSGVIGFLGFVFGGTFQIETMLSDGSQLKVVSNFASGPIAQPTLSPNGATFAYVDGGNVWTIPSGGGTPTEIFNLGTAYDAPPVWSPSSAQIAFTVNGASRAFIETMSPTGTGVTNITPGEFATGNLIAESWSPDGTSLICTYQAGGTGNTSNALISIFPNDSALVLTPTGFNDTCPTLSPDGAKIAFYRSSASGATPGIYVSDIQGANPQLILSDNGASGIAGPIEYLAWSPFQAGQTFVGSHGTITASPVSGFLVSQNASVFASLLTFTTTTPSTATLTQSASNASGAPLAFTLGGDSITNISYTNVYSGAHQTLTLTSTPSALVTIDGQTGFVDLVAPAIAGKGHPMVAKASGSSLTYTGSFAAIYDGTGKNLAPGGATTIQLDRTTGKVISFH